MKKAISSFVATVLLIGFTVAVGAILSVWFTTFTRTQTAAVQSGAMCQGANVRVFSNVTTTPTPSNGALKIYVQNLRNDVNITVNTIYVTCGSTATNLTTTFPIPSGTINSTDMTGLSGCTLSNTAITVVGNCSSGGSFVSSCPMGGCGLY
jgi:FlaG/FlaF family flagellin (archaellin)